MTEVFIAALSTTKLEMNDEDLQFYRDEKAKEIQEVRLALQNLHQFGLLHKKERALANHPLIWKSLLILSKIIGYQSEFALIDQLRIPQAILTQQLWMPPDIFILKHYYPRTNIGSWETTAQKYYILMQGIVEKELIRTSILKFEGNQNLELSGCRVLGNSKFRRQNRKRFARTDQQIPICLNSKRSEGRNMETVPGNFRSLTDVEMFQVSAACWKRYVSNFKRLQEEYLMNFIRKRMNISLNFDLFENAKSTIRKDSRKEQESLQDSFYSIVTLERKSCLEFNSSEIYLLYMGEMLVTTPHYKIETSRGCVLNPVIHHALARRKTCTDLTGIAVAKNLSTVIKISIKKLSLYFQEHSDERETLTELLIELQNNRRVKNEEQKLGNSIQISQTESLRCRPSKMTHKLACESGREVVFNKIWHSSSKGKPRDRVIGLKSIENMVQKTAKAAQLKHIEYLKKAHLSQDVHHNKYGQENAIIPFAIFKDCMKNIQNKNETLKQAIRIQRQKFKHQLEGGGRKLMNDYRSESLPSRAKMVPLADSTIYLRKKIKDIYVKTEGSEELINFATSSERQTVAKTPVNPSRQTVGPSTQLQQVSDKDFDSIFGSFGRGVMKKVQTGKIRRVNIK